MQIPESCCPQFDMAPRRDYTYTYTYTRANHIADITYYHLGDRECECNSVMYPHLYCVFLVRPVGEVAPVIAARFVG